MHASDVAEPVIAFVTSVAIIALPLAVLAVVGARLTRRRLDLVVAVASTLLSISLGYALLASDTIPLLRVSAILAMALLLGILVVNDRVTTAGLALIAASSPWTLFAGAWLLDAVLGVPRIRTDSLLPPFVGGVVGIVAGVSLIRFHRTWIARHPEKAAETAAVAAPPARAWNTASQVVSGPAIAGLTVPGAAAAVAIFAGSQVAVVAGHGRPILEALAVIAIGSIATGLAAVVASGLARRGRSRRAFEAFAWLGESEFERFGTLTDHAMAPTVANMKRYVRNTPERPEDRWLRVEARVLAGDLPGARDLAARMPDDTPVNRAEREGYLYYVDWLAGSDAEPDAFRAAVAAIEPADGDDHLRAEVALALAETRRLAVASDPDPAVPLRAVRDRIGQRADGVRLIVARRQLPGFLKVSAAFVTVVTLIDRAFTP